MTCDVGNAVLTPNFLEKANQGAVNVSVMTKEIYRTESTTMPTLFDPLSHSCTTHALSTHIIDFLHCLRDIAAKRLPSRVAPITLYVLDYSAGRCFGTIKSTNRIGCKAQLACLN